MTPTVRLFSGTLVVAGALMLAACGGGTDDPVPTRLVPADGATPSGTVATVLAPVTLTVLDGQGRAMPGTTVTAQVTAGGGSVATSTFTSDATGRVTVGGWTLGTAAGAQSLTLRAGDATLTLTAQAGAAAPATVSALPGQPTQGLVGRPLASAPAVRVADAFGNPVAGASVTFDLGAFDGSLANRSVTTDALGVARATDWTLGERQGTQTLLVRVAGGAATEIAVNAALAAGCEVNPIAVGLPYTGQWATGDCVDTASGQRYDEYRLDLKAPAAFKARVAGVQGRQIRVYTAAGALVADMPSDAFAPAAVDPLEIQYALPAGDYRIRVGAPTADHTGAYTLDLGTDFSTAVTDAATCRPVIFTTPGATIDQALDRQKSCPFLGGTEDRYIVLMTTGESIRLTLSTQAFIPRLIFRDDRSPTAPMLTSAVGTEPGTVEVTWTATFTGFHEVIVTSRNFVSSGAYRLQVARP